MDRHPKRFNRRDVLRTSLAVGGSFALGTNSVAAAGDSNSEPSFYDDWEDGDYTTNPGWRVYSNEGDFSARVTSRSTPRGGRHVLRISETMDFGTDGIIGWQDGQTGWDGEWTLRGLFYTENVPLNSDFQGHNVILYDDPNENDKPLAAKLGFKNPRGRSKPFILDGDLIDSVQKTLAVDWQEDVWYHYEVTHDGTGTYLGRIWQDGAGRPTTPSAKSVGTPPGTERRFASLQINGANRRTFDVDHAFVEWRPGSKGGGNGSLEELISKKDAKINSIQGLAGQTIGDGSAESNVDQSARELLTDIEQDNLDASDEQYERALKRMNAAESVTETSTGAVVGDDSPTSKTSENIYSFATGAAIELIPEVGERIGAGILKRVNASLVDDVTTYLDDLVKAARGNGALPNSALKDLDDEFNAYKVSQASRSESAIRNNEKLAEQTVDSVSGNSLKAGKLYAEATNPNAKQNLLDSLEEILFDTYYFSSDLPPVDVPVPSEIDLPELNVSYNVPDEQLPLYLRGAVPDKINFSSGDLDIPLTDTPVLGDVSQLLDAYQDDVSQGGINTTIDAKMDHLRSNISSLSEQDASARENVQRTATDAIDAVETLLNDILIDGLEEIEDVLSLGATLASAGSVAALAGAAALILTGVGAGALLGVAGALATVATALSVATLVIDAVQIASGFGFAMIDNEIHQLSTYLLAEDDLAGVNL